MDISKLSFFYEQTIGFINLIQDGCSKVNLKQNDNFLIFLKANYKSFHS